MKKSIFYAGALSALLLIVNCSKNKGEGPVGEFPAQIAGLPLGASPSNISQELPGSDTVRARGIIARKSAWLRYNTQINSNVTVVGNCQGQGCLDPALAPTNPKAINNADSELTVGVNVIIPAAYTIKADKIRLKQNAKVQGSAEANTYAQQKTATIANKVSPLGLLPNLPFFVSGTPGTIDRTDAHSPLAPGQYRHITVRKGKTLVLTGGFYQLNEVDMAAEATLTCASQCTVLIKTDFVSAKRITVAAASTNPNDFLFYVEGGNPTANPMDATARAVAIGGLSHITANFYAPNGRLQFAQATIAQGLFIANHVRIEPNSVVTQGPEVQGIAKFFEAGEAGSVEIPGKVKLEFPAGALTEDTIISVVAKPPIPATQPRSPAQLRFVGESFDFQPDGLTFAQNYTLTMNYNPAQVSAIGVTPNDIRIFNAPTGSVAFTASPTTLVAASSQLVASDNHFTFFSVGSSGGLAAVSALAALGDTVYPTYGYTTVNPHYMAVTKYSIASKVSSPQSQVGVLGAPAYRDFQPQVLGDKLLLPSYGVNLGTGFFDFAPKWYDSDLSLSTGCNDGIFLNSVSQHMEIGLHSGNYYLLASVLNRDPMLGYILPPAFIVVTPINNGSGGICSIAPFSAGIAGDYASFTTVNQYLIGVSPYFGTGIEVQPDFLNPSATTGALYGQSIQILKSKGNYALLGAWADGQPTVRTYDPVTNSEYFHPTGSLAHTLDFAITGNVVYALQDGFPGQIVELDMTNPASPQPPLSVHPVGFGTYHMAQSGNYLVVAEGTFSTPSLRLINIGFPVRGTVTGLPGGGSVQLLNTVTTGTAPKTTVAADGTYQNAELIADGNSYNFKVAAKPPGYSCIVYNASGVMDFHNPPTNVNVLCYPSQSWVPTGNIAGGRLKHTATLLHDGRVLIVGGLSSNGTLATAEIFDLTLNGGVGGFVSTGSMASPRQLHTATLLNDGRVLITGGEDDSSPLKSAEIFDPSGNGGLGSFTTTASMSVARYIHAASLLSDGYRVLVVGGSGPNGAVWSSAEIFDPTASAGAGAFSNTGSMTSKRGGIQAIRLPNNGILVAGGFNNVYLNSAEIFYPALNGGLGGFASTGSLSVPRQAYSASSLPDGRVIITGGYELGPNVSNLAEIFDFAANAGAGAFVSTGNMMQPRLYHTTTLLADGTMLTAGGTSFSFSLPLSTAELFDPAGNAGLGNFSFTTSLATPRVLHSAIRLQDGRVLVVGGFNGVNYLNTAAIFQP